MKIIRIWGGLGNQMFQFALYLKLKKLLKGNIKIDLDHIQHWKIHNGYELGLIFNIDEKVSTVEEAFYAGSKNSIYRQGNIFKKAYYKMLLKKKLFKKDKIKESIVYYPEVFDTSCEYIQGYWANERYFSDISDIVKGTYRFPDIDAKNSDIAYIMQNSNSISIHIRRGDYLNPENNFFVNISETEYYKRAIKHIENNITNPQWFVFSNDMDFCRENLNLTNATFVDWNVGVDSYRDMQLMSLCKHNIIANSSFSFWGAYLNKNPNKIVIAPKEWYIFKDCSYEDICPKDWVRISCE